LRFAFATQHFKVAHPPMCLFNVQVYVLARHKVSQ
jgi:hypothetical protein